MKRMCIKIVLMMVPVFFMALATMSQGVVKGKVVDSETKEVLIGATVMVEGLSLIHISEPTRR